MDLLKGVTKYFRSSPAKSAEEIREFINEKKAWDYNLVDVRQLREYEEKHIPGARLIPVGEIGDRLSEIDPDKPTLVY
jgi:rhodanese-related sulfurtransferase